MSKKEWMKKCFEDGLVFLKSVERGKCFIEYIPAEHAWVPIIAENYMYIDCFWVSGVYKGHGYSNDLLNACIEESKEKGKVGLCILSAAKKKPFLSDPKHLLYKGFKVADESEAGIQLWYLPFEENTVIPRFKECAKHPHIETVAKENNVPFRAIRITTKEEAQSLPSPCTTYALFYNGSFLTNEQLNDKKFLKMLEKTSSLS